MLPFVIRKFTGEEVTENDKVFYHEGLLSKFIEVPNIIIDGKFHIVPTGWLQIELDMDNWTL